MELSELWDVKHTCKYVLHNGYKAVTLQFPDDLLADAPLIADNVQSHLRARGSDAKVYTLADTSYNPLSVDEVAAAHVNADCIIHYGYASLNPVSRTPALCVLPKLQLDVQQCALWVAEQLAGSEWHTRAAQAGQRQAGSSQCAVICCDQGYLHLLPQLQEAMLLAYQGPLQLIVAQTAACELEPQHRIGKAGASSSVGNGTQQQQHHQTVAASNSSTAYESQTCCQAPQQQPQQCCAHTACSSDAARHTTAGSPQEPRHCADSNSQQPEQSTTTAAPGGGVNTDSIQPPIGGLVWQLPSSCDPDNKPLMVWLGPPDSPALTHLQLTHSTHLWLLLDPATLAVRHGLAHELDRLLRRRYYLVERARGATMIGLLVGTLGAAGYLQALQALRKLAAQAGKKTYTLLMGKPNPAKLANFPELEVFVMLADPQGLILDCKEYLNPIVTPHEAYLAFTGRPFDVASYRLDFGDLTGSELGSQQLSKVSATTMRQELGDNVNSHNADSESAGGQLHSGGYHGVAGLALSVAGGHGAVAPGAGMQNSKQLQVQSAAHYLMQHRTYQGLITPAIGAEILPVEKAVVGRAGRAAGYSDEPTRS